MATDNDGQEIEHAGSNSPEGVTGVELEFLVGSRRGEEQKLPEVGEYAIGCAPECVIRFEQRSEPFVSRHHASIIIHTDHVELRDEDSSNGTYVNGEILSRPRYLYHGDVVELGTDGPRFRFNCTGNACARSLGDRSTVIIPKRGQRNTLAETLRPDDSSPPRKLILPLALALILLILALSYVTLSQRRADSRQNQKLTELRAELTHAEGNPLAVGVTLAKEYSPGVFLIALRVSEEGFAPGSRKIPWGHLKPAGTAWAIDKSGVLVTNAHVVRFIEDQYKRYKLFIEMVAVQNGTGKIYRIRRTLEHPECNLKDMTNLTTDVALLWLNGEVPVVLPPATRKRAQELGSGEAVYSIGFPIETASNMGHFYAYDTPDRVIATIRSGVVQRVTAADGRLGTSANQQLVHIDIPTVSGQSGSPVFNTRGEVVSILNATAVANIGGAAMPHPGVFTYSVRIDVLLDMIRDLTDPEEDK